MQVNLLQQLRFQQHGPIQTTGWSNRRSPLRASAAPMEANLMRVVALKCAVSISTAECGLRDQSRMTHLPGFAPPGGFSQPVGHGSRRGRQQ